MSIRFLCSHRGGLGSPPLPDRSFEGLLLPSISRWPVLTSSTAASSAALLGPDSRSLEQAFSAYGEVLDSKIINVRETGRSRGFGFVTFGTERVMKDAIEGMNGQNLDERSITVNEAQSRSGGGGGGGFRSGGYDNGSGRREGGGYSHGGSDHGYGSPDRGYGGGSDGGSWRN